jgi:hypothetical protein
MKGLELSKAFFNEVGLPMIEKEFRQYMDRIAIGLVGDGSDCFGFDDEISKDHDWGPGFCIWLTREDYQVIGQQLKSAYQRMPKSFKGYENRKTSQWGDNRTGVFEINQFYQNFIGFDRIPATVDEWLMIPENSLAACTNGDLFFDHRGEFAWWRKILSAFYPEDVRLKKIASRCMTAGQAGQYNLERSISRNEYFSAQYAVTKFCADIISLVFLLNRKYTPFYKWMHRAVNQLPVLGKNVYQSVLAITKEPQFEKKSEHIARFCAEVVKELNHQGLSDTKSDFLLEHGPIIQKRITDPHLRKRNVWVG